MDLHLHAEWVFFSVQEELTTAGESTLQDKIVSRPETEEEESETPPAIESDSEGLCMRPTPTRRKIRNAFKPVRIQIIDLQVVATFILSVKGFKRHYWEKSQFLCNIKLFTEQWVPPNDFSVTAIYTFIAIHIFMEVLPNIF